MTSARNYVTMLKILSAILIVSVQDIGCQHGDGREIDNTKFGRFITPPISSSKKAIEKEFTKYQYVKGDNSRTTYYQRQRRSHASHYQILQAINSVIDLLGNIHVTVDTTNNRDPDITIILPPIIGKRKSFDFDDEDIPYSSHKLYKRLISNPMNNKIETIAIDDEINTIDSTPLPPIIGKRTEFSDEIKDNNDDNIDDDNVITQDVNIERSVRFFNVLDDLMDKIKNIIRQDNKHITDPTPPPSVIGRRNELSVKGQGYNDDTNDESSDDVSIGRLKRLLLIKDYKIDDILDEINKIIIEKQDGRAPRHLLPFDKTVGDLLDKLIEDLNLSNSKPKPDTKTPPISVIG